MLEMRKNAMQLQERRLQSRETHFSTPRRRRRFALQHNAAASAEVVKRRMHDININSKHCYSFTSAVKHFLRDVFISYDELRRVEWKISWEM